MTRITVWDGANCVGGNKILLEDGNLTLWFDFGLNLSLQMKYYEEFLKPQTARGLYELLVMGLLPPVGGIYTERFIDGYRFSDWMLELNHVDGVLLSHAHSDHCGCLQYLHADIPLYCSLESALLLRALQDTGNDDGSIYVCRHTYDAESGTLKKADWRGKENVAIFRQVHVAGNNLPDDARRLWRTLPSNRQEKCELRDLRPHAGTIAGRRCEFLPVDHSIPGAGAWAVETEAGWVVYTGDLRFRGMSGHLSEKFIEQAAQLEPIALIIEGTRITREGSGYTENTVREQTCKLLEQYRYCPIIVNFSTTHLERLELFWQCAREYNRRFVVNAKNLYLLHAWRQTGHNLPLENGSLLVYQGTGQKPFYVWERELIDRYSQQTVTAKQIAQKPADYMLSFGYYDLNELPYIGVKEGVWIQSFSEPMSEEQRLSDERLNRWLQRFGFFRYPPQGSADEETVPLHVSGHASGEELRKVVETIRPKRLIPVHTTEPERFEELFSGICEVTIPHNGEEIVL